MVYHGILWYAMENFRILLTVRLLFLYSAPFFGRQALFRATFKKLKKIE